MLLGRPFSPDLYSSGQMGRAGMAESAAKVRAATAKYFDFEIWTVDVYRVFHRVDGLGQHSEFSMVLACILIVATVNPRRSRGTRL